VTTFWVLATAATIGCISRRLTGNAETAYLTALLYVLFTPTFVPQALSTNGEIIMNLPLALSVLFFLKSQERKPVLLWGTIARPNSLAAITSFPGGFFCGVAFLVKYQGGIMLAVILFYILIAKPLLSPKWPGKAAFIPSLFVLAGFASILVAIHGIFRYLGNWEDFYFWGWKYNFIFMGEFTWPYFFKRFFGMTPRFILVWLILWVFAFAAIKRAVQSPAPIHTGHHLMILWLAGSALAVCAGGKFFGHYYIQLLPPLAILAAGSIVAWRQKSRSLPLGKWQRAFVLAGIVIPPVIYLGANWREELKRVNGENQYMQALAVKVQQRSADGDPIFVWGRMPELYYFSRRLPASRFITCNFLVGMTTYDYYEKNAKPDSAFSSPIWDSLFSDLARNRPKLIIDTSPRNFRQYGKYPISEFPRLHDYLSRHYHLVETIDQLSIYSIAQEKL
jgi:hypothetical protein